MKFPQALVNVVNSEKFISRLNNITELSFVYGTGGRFELELFLLVILTNLVVLRSLCTGYVNNLMYIFTIFLMLLDNYVVIFIVMDRKSDINLCHFCNGSYILRYV